MGARRGGQTGVAIRGWPYGVARRGWPYEGGHTGWPDGGPDGAGRGARRGPEGVLDGVPVGARWSTRRARRGGGRKDYLLLKEKMTCSVYVSCKSSSASDMSDAG
jgi:hypothetical protein